MKKIILLGMMGSGKSTVSKELSKLTKIERYDLDEIFEKENNIPICDFFKEFGENTFRQKESEILFKTAQKKEFIISTGGGIILKKENRDFLFDSNNFTTVYLKTSVDIIYKRIKTDSTRPLLKVDNPKEEIKNILLKRENCYSQAKITILTDEKTPLAIAKEILEKYENNWNINKWKF